jgi:hypothetical protein
VTRATFRETRIGTHTQLERNTRETATAIDTSNKRALTVWHSHLRSDHLRDILDFLLRSTKT